MCFGICFSQGWIKQMQAEAFSYALGYNNTDYAAIGTTATVLATPIATAGAASKGLYNGNIASMTSKTPKMVEMPNQQAILQQQYSYDQLNRITASNTLGVSDANAYRTRYSYDANGNIKSLSRYDGQGVKFDTLLYNYETKAKDYLKNTNKLRWVDDAPTVSATTADIEDQSADNYSYDAIGNLVKDNQEQIDTIEWTVSGKVLKVRRTAASTKPDLEFEYDASGQRIVKKVIRKDGSIASTYYLRDASGNVMAVYEYNSVSDDLPQLSEQYIYGSSRIGVALPGAGTVITALENILASSSFGRKSYELSDHLGNVRATLSDYRRLASQAIVNSATDYYPFGMVARSYTSSQQYRYGYQQAEYENDITTGDFDFGARIYDPRIARWLAVDPKRTKYPYLSPYCFVNNSPIYLVEKDGEDFEIVVDHATKTITIVANVYVDNESADRALVAVNELNTMDIKYQYSIVDDNGLTHDYKVKFDITPILSEDPVASAKSDPIGNSFQLEERDIPIVIFGLTAKSLNEYEAGGVNFGKKYSFVPSDETNVTETTDIHELLHSFTFDGFHSNQQGSYLFPGTSGIGNQVTMDIVDNMIKNALNPQRTATEPKVTITEKNETIETPVVDGTGIVSPKQ